ncbi:MAG: tetratricopeptide repeat protein [Cyclobacteriaceae bacterium]
MRIYQWILLFSLHLPVAFAQQTPGEAPTYRPDQASQTALNEAQKYFDEKRYSLALEVLNSLTSKNAAYAEAFRLRGKTKIALQDPKGAFTDFSAAIHLAPEKTDYLFDRAILAFQMERWKIALEDFHQVLKSADTETTTVYFKGSTDAHGFSTSGITTLQSDMKADIYNYLGLLHMKTAQLDSADYYLDLASERNPYEADIYVNMGLLELNRGDTLQAIDSFKKALSYKNDHQEALQNLSAVTSTSQKETIMKEILDQAVNETGSYQAFYHRGVMLQQKGEHRRAVKDFDQAIALAGNQPELLLMRAYSREYSADWQGAINDYITVTRLEPTEAKAYTNLGNVYYKLKKYDKAAIMYETALKFNPEASKLYYNAGLAHYMSGDKELSCKYLQKAVDRGFSAANQALQKYCL